MNNPVYIAALVPFEIFYPYRTSPQSETRFAGTRNWVSLGWWLNRLP